MRDIKVRGIIKGNLIGDKSFYKSVVAIVLPIIIQNTITNVVSLVDNVMVGRVGMLEMSSVAIVNQLLVVFNLCIFGGLAGAGIFTAQFAGAKDDEGVRYTFRFKVLLSVLILAAAFLVFILFDDPLIKMYVAEDTAPEDIVKTVSFGKQYLSVMLLGIVPFALSQVYSGTLRELGETKMPMLSGVIAILINLIFNYFLIFGTFGFPKLGVVGAAIATVISRYAELLIIAVYTHLRGKKYTFIHGVYKSVRIPFSLFKRIFIKGTPLLINEFLWATGTAVLLQCYSVRGLPVVSAMNIASTVNNLFNAVFLSMGTAISIMVGQHLGANETTEAKLTAGRLLFLDVAASVVLGVVMALCAPFIPLLYNVPGSVQELATYFLYVVAITMPIEAFAQGCYFTLRSGGKTFLTFVFDSLFMCFVSIPVAFVLANFTAVPVVLLYFAVMFTNLGKCILGFVFVKKGIWIQNIIRTK